MRKLIAAGLASALAAAVVAVPATAQTVTGTVPSGEGAWGTETHTPSRFYFKNDSNQIWRLGTMSITGGTTTGSAGLGTSTTGWCGRC